MTLEQLEKRLAQLAELRKAAEARSSAVLDVALAANRTMTDEEAATVAEARAEVAKIDTEVKPLDDQAQVLRKAQADADAANPAGDTDEKRKDDAADAEKRNGGAKVKAEPLTYQRHSLDPVSYLHDLVLIETGQGRGERSEALDRLTRHAKEMSFEAPAFEERMWGGRKAPDSLGDEKRNEAGVEYEKRDLNRTDGTGGYFVPPVWMMEDYIDLARGSRVIADAVQRFPLPAGTDSINIPKVATGTTVAIQTADNATVDETDLTDSSVSAGVKTIAGQQDVSLQAFEQSPLAFDQVILADLAGDHAVKTDVQVINGSNASGQVRGILNIASVDTTAYTDASPTVAELYPKLADSYQQIAGTRYRIPEAIFMHPRRWAWMLAAVDSANRPLVAMAAQGPNNALAAISGAAAEGGPVGMTPYGDVFLDPNIPITEGGGTEDVIILTRPSELYLWESAVRTRILTEVLSGNLTVRIQLYNYLAFMPDRRPESTSIVSGTGLAAPTF